MDLAPALQPCRVAIAEPADVWRHWLQRSVFPAATTHAYSSAQALLTALEQQRYDLLIVAFRLRGVDGFEWIRLLRGSPSGRAARLIACVGTEDSSGSSLALLAGADEVFCKVAQATALARRLAECVRGPAGHAVARPCALLERPVFNAGAGSGPNPNRLVDARTLAFDFLDVMVDYASRIEWLYDMPSKLVTHVLQDFADLAGQAGARRLAYYTELMVAQLRAGGRLHSGLRDEYAAMIADTTREMATWLLERPALDR